MKEKAQAKISRNDFLFVIGHIRFSWIFIILAVIATIGASMLSAKIPNETAQLFDGNFAIARLWKVIWASLLVTAITLAAGVFRLYAETKSLLSARNSIWRQMLTTRSEYYDGHDPASLLSLVTVDAENMSRGLVALLTYIPQMATMLVLSIVMISQYNQRLLIVLWIVIPLHFIYMFFVGQWQKRIGKDLSIAVGGLSGYLAERIRNLVMIKTFSAENKEDANGIETSGKLYKVSKRYAYLGVVLGSYSSVSAAVTTVLTVIWGCYLLREGTIDVPAFLGFNMYIQCL